MTQEPNWNDYSNFSREEFVCNCGCNRAEMKPGFMRSLQNLRTELNFPIKINSGYRCPDYNDQVSSTGLDGPHTTGLAADISVYGNKAWTLLRTATKNGFLGIGIDQKGITSKRFIHLDMMPEGSTRPRIWSY